MPLVRKTYRGCKVWAEVDEQGRLVEQRGLTQIRYRQDAKEGYSAKVAEIGDVAPSPPGDVAASADVPAPVAAPKAAAPRRPRSRKPKAAGAHEPVPTGGVDEPGDVGAAGEVIVAYADGSCFGNPGPAGIGVLLEWKGRVKEVSRYLGEGTNNIAELSAIEAALLEVKNRSLPVRIHTDSAYSIGVLQEGWRAKENKELVARVQTLLREFPDVRLVKVRGHAGDPRNERVDQLARDAITRRT